ncbi:MAG: phosphate acyltransferase PlsX [Clostridia bacterium]|nr:phosphate acyltransferase PlsX [Clostridia bacterium]
MIKIIVDAMGGDNAPYSTVAGAVQALAADKEIHLVLTGRQAEIEGELKKYSFDKTRLEIVDCPDVIDMNDIPTEAVKRKQSSLMQAYWMLKKEEDLCALVTAGSTGATIVGGQLILGRIRGIKRPALCPAIPNTRGGVTLLLDCGANAECKPVMLCQFALLGSAYAKAGFGINNPKVGLLNNGTEEHKGDPLRQETFKYMSQMEGIDFIGNVEGRDIMIGDCDVVVADGFSGNVALKSMEGCGKLVLGVLKKELSSSLSSKIGYLFIRKAIKRMRGQLDFDKMGGALLLGLKKPVIKSHGSSKPETIKNSIINAANIYRGKLVPAVEELLSTADLDNLTEQTDEV